MSWRTQCAPIIERVLRETRGRPEREIRAALQDAYPFGIRKYFPYKIWLDEIKVQRGLKRCSPERRKELAQVLPQPTPLFEGLA